MVVECPDFPYLGLWTADKPFDTGYFCIEPWSALPDAVFVGRGLEDKAGIRPAGAGGRPCPDLYHHISVNRKEKIPMKPEYANTFLACARSLTPGLQILEVTLDISYKYMENALTVTSNGLENVSTPNADHVASIVMNRQSAISLRNLLIQSLGDETL